MTPGMTGAQRKLALWQSFVTAWLTLTAGAGLTDVVGSHAAALLALTGAAMNAATTTYIAAMRPQQTGTSADNPPVSSR